MYKRQVWEFQYAGNLTDLGAGVYSQTFTGPDGSTDLEDGSVIFGAAASLQDNALRLTIDGRGLGFSSFSVPGIAGSSSGWTATFDYELFDSAGNNNPADGFSFNYGNAELGEQGGAEEGEDGIARSAEPPFPCRGRPPRTLPSLLYCSFLCTFTAPARRDEREYTQLFYMLFYIIR